MIPTLPPFLASLLENPAFGGIFEKDFHFLLWPFMQEKKGPLAQATNLALLEKLSSNGPTQESQDKLPCLGLLFRSALHAWLPFASEAERIGLRPEKFATQITRLLIPLYAYATKNFSTKVQSNLARKTSKFLQDNPDAFQGILLNAALILRNWLLGENGLYSPPPKPSSLHSPPPSPDKYEPSFLPPLYTPPVSPEVVSYVLSSLKPIYKDLWDAKKREKSPGYVFEGRTAVIDKERGPNRWEVVFLDKDNRYWTLGSRTLSKEITESKGQTKTVSVQVSSSFNAKNKAFLAAKHLLLAGIDVENLRSSESSTSAKIQILQQIFEPLEQGHLEYTPSQKRSMELAARAAFWVEAEASIADRIWRSSLDFSPFVFRPKPLILYDTLKRAKKFVSKDSLDPAMKAIFFDVSGWATATDGHRLAQIPTAYRTKQLLLPLQHGGYKELDLSSVSFPPVKPLLPPTWGGEARLGGFWSVEVQAASFLDAVKEFQGLGGARTSADSRILFRVKSSPTPVLDLTMIGNFKPDQTDMQGNKTGYYKTAPVPLSCRVLGKMEEGGEEETQDFEEMFEVTSLADAVDKATGTLRFLFSTTVPRLYLERQDGERHLIMPLRFSISRIDSIPHLSEFAKNPNQRR